MAAMSDYLENELLDHVLRNSSYTPPTTVYVALHSADPTDAGNGAELSGNGYARQAATFAAASSGDCSTSADITFTASGGAWSAATHFGIWDASTNGNLLYHGALDTSRTAGDGDSIIISSGNLTITHA